MSRSFLLIMIGVAAWGLFHAVGAYYFNHNLARSLVVSACVALFLGFWLLMLRSRRRRLLRDDQMDAER